MKNHQYIRKLSVKELAKLLIKEVEVNEGDFDFDDELCDYYVTRYYMPDGDYHSDYESALSCTIDWLNSEKK